FLGVVDNKKMKQRALSVFKKLNIDIDLNRMAGILSVGMQQMLEISKALMEKPKIIIMDEPTAALTNNVIATLFEQINRLKNEGVSFIYIFIRMVEIFRISYRISVMRDVNSIIISKKKVKTHALVVEYMIIRNIDNQ